MPLPTMPSPALISALEATPEFAALQQAKAALRATPEGKVMDLIERIRLIRDIARYTREPTVRVRRLHDWQGSLFDHKDEIQRKSLANAASRAALAASEAQYANAAEVTTDIQALNGLFDQLTAAMERVLDPIRTAGQLVDNDTNTGQRVNPVIPAAALTEVRTIATTILASLG